MIVGVCPATRRRLRTASISVLLIVLALALPLEANQRFHTHDASTAGIYNSDCPLAALAAFHSIGLLPAAASPARVVLLAGATVLASGARLFAPAVRHTDPRAPPLV